MRQSLSISDEAHLLVRSLSVDYSAAGVEDVHSHPWAQFLYAQSGAMRAEIRDQVWMIPPRRGLWIPAAAPHELKRLGMVKLRTLYCRSDITRDQQNPRVVDVCGLLHEAILRSCELLWLDQRESAEHRLAELIMNEIAHAESSSVTLRLPRDPRARRLADQFLTLYDGNLEHLYGEVGLSRRTGERLFLKETGLSPSRWRRVALLSRGLEEIANGQRIQQVAEMVGYRSRAAFSDAFSKLFGLSPSQIARRVP